MRLSTTFPVVLSVHGDNCVLGARRGLGSGLSRLMQPRLVRSIRSAEHC